MPDEERQDSTPIQEPKEKQMQEPKIAPLQEPERRSLLTGSEDIQFKEDVDYVYAPPSGSQPPSPEQQAAAQQEPPSNEKPSSGDQETIQE